MLGKLIATEAPSTDRTIMLNPWEMTLNERKIAYIPDELSSRLRCLHKMRLPPPRLLTKSDSVLTIAVQ